MYEGCDQAVQEKSNPLFDFRAWQLFLFKSAIQHVSVDVTRGRINAGTPPSSPRGARGQSMGSAGSQGSGGGGAH